MIEKITNINNNAEKIIEYYLDVIYRKDEINNTFDLLN